MTFGGGFGRVFRPVFDPGLTARNGLLNALIAYWPGNEASGNALDAHTNALYLADTGSVSSAAGNVYALARSFDGVASRVLRRGADDALLSTGDVDFTLAAWVKWTAFAGAANHIAGKDSETAGGREYRLDWLASANRIRMRVFDGSAQVGIATADNLGAPSSGIWYLVVGWHDAANNVIGIQINNGTVDSAATTGAPSDTAQPFSIGRCANSINSPASAIIGPVAMWKSAAGGGGVLSSAQRLALWNNGAGLAYTQFTT